jgi:hypothetical protein
MKGSRFCIYFIAEHKLKLIHKCNLIHEVPQINSLHLEVYSIIVNEILHEKNL